MTSSKGFQLHFYIISKFVCCGCYLKKNAAFALNSFSCTEMTWMFIISTTIWVNGWDTSSVASRARSELTSLKCNWKGNQKGKGTDETPLGSILKHQSFPIFYKQENGRAIGLTWWLFGKLGSSEWAKWQTFWPYNLKNKWPRKLCYAWNWLSDHVAHYIKVIHPN